MADIIAKSKNLLFSCDCRALGGNNDNVVDVHVIGDYNFAPNFFSKLNALVASDFWWRMNQYICSTINYL